MDLGTLYVAPLGTSSAVGWSGSTPGLVFSDPWPAEWNVAAYCDISIDGHAQFNRDITEIRVAPPAGFLPVMTHACLDGGPFMLGYETHDRTRRYVFPRAGSMSINVRAGAPNEYVFEALNEDPVAVFWASMTAVQPLPRRAVIHTAHHHRPPARKPYGGEAVELVPGRLRGFREWKIVRAAEGEPPRLAAISARTIWPWTPVIEARCHRADMGAMYAQFERATMHDPLDVPNADCSCGIYAKHKPMNLNPGHDRVYGVIEAWGKVELGTNGFRAQKARLVALGGAYDQPNGYAVTARFTDLLRMDPTPWHGGPNKDTLAQLGELYRVPTFPDFAEMWAKYPPADVDELLGLPPEPKRTFNSGGPVHGPGKLDSMVLADLLKSMRAAEWDKLFKGNWLGT